MKIHKTYLGYWYQRTTLHLSEIYDFFAEGNSKLWLNKRKLAELHKDLQIKNVELKTDILEKITLQTNSGIKIQVFEDGLVLLHIEHSIIKQDIKKLTQYYEEHFAPAISYLFSLGAPVPKELANIKTAFPYFITTTGCSKINADRILADADEHEYLEIKSTNTEIYRGNKYYIINSTAKDEDIEELVGMLVFFREFKAQLHHYLNLHRAIWEKIEHIKEQRHVRARGVENQRLQLDAEKKTVELIEGRINQMATYIETRSAIVENTKLGTWLHDILEFRYDNLKNSLDYVKSLWSMTKQYLDSAIAIFGQINELSTRNAVEALTIISSIGVIGGIVGFLSKTELPKLTGIGGVYLLCMLLGAFLLNRLLKLSFSFIKYKIADYKIGKLTINKKL